METFQDNFQLIVQVRLLKDAFSNLKQIYSTQQFYITKHIV